MGFWPFGGGKRQRAQETEERAKEKPRQEATAEVMARLEKAATDLGATNSQDRSRRLSKTRIPSYGPQQRSQTESLSSPRSKRRQSGTSQLEARNIYQQQNPTSQSSLGPDTFHVIRTAPTLHARRNDYDPNLPRRKSSKRKAEDYAREREIRAMSSSPIPIPKRPATFQDSSPLRKETRDIPGDLNRKLRRPTSQVSLPIPETLLDLNDTTPQNAFKIGTFAALSPRPTVRYDNNPRTDRGKQPIRANPPLQQPIPEEDAPDKKRIDELADDLDAGGLRELMERDRRRRERKKEYDKAKLQRKLQRRADRQKEEEETRRARTEEYVSRSTSRLGHARDADIEAHSEAGPSRSVGRSDPFRDPDTEPAASSAPIRNPFEDEKDLDVEDRPSESEPEPAVPVRSPLRNLVGRQPTGKYRGQQGPSPPTSPQTRAIDRQSFSQASFTGRDTTPEVSDAVVLERRASDQSSQRISNWTSFFKRGTRRKLSTSFQGRSTPSEFSNTSRESFAKRQQPPPIVTERTFRRVGSATPQRTMSKFREDLPELPLSPPDSRVQSPEAATIPARVSGITQGLNTAVATNTSAHHETTLTPTSPISGKISRVDKGSMDLDTPASVKAEIPLSQSLASVDSEASWLSGKPLKRLSGNATSQLRQNVASPQPPAAHETGEGEGSANQDEPGPAVLDDGERDGNETWHSGLGRQPTLIKQAPRAKSKEGLLNEYQDAKAPISGAGTDDEDHEMGSEEAELQEAPIMRARSVEYKGHARHISAGSARLLDLRRGSVQSTSSAKKSPGTSTADLTQQGPS